MSKTVIQQAIEVFQGEDTIVEYLQSLLPEEKKQMEPNAEMKALLERLIAEKPTGTQWYKLQQEAQQLLNKLNT